MERVIRVGHVKWRYQHQRDMVCGDDYVYSYFSDLDIHHSLLENRAEGERTAHVFLVCGWVGL